MENSAYATFRIPLIASDNKFPGGHGNVRFGDFKEVLQNGFVEVDVHPPSFTMTGSLALHASLQGIEPA